MLLLQALGINYGAPDPKGSSLQGGYSNGKFAHNGGDDVLEVDNHSPITCLCQPARHGNSPEVTPVYEAELQRQSTQGYRAVSEAKAMPALSLQHQQQQLPLSGRNAWASEDPLPTPQAPLGNRGPPPLPAPSRRESSANRATPRRRSSSPRGTPRSLPSGAIQAVREWREEQVTKSGIRYTGEWLGEFMDGQGTAIMPDGGVYKGQFVMNKAEGDGTFTTVKGDVYEGQWKENQAAGHGIYRGSNGRTYVGQWAKDTQHGEGTETVAGTKYTGTFKNGMKHGSGRFVWADGSVYDGQFDNNSIHGWGVHVWNNGRKYEGQWNKEKMHGRGTYSFASGSVFDGEYVQDQKHGWGTFRWADGHVYTGYWENGQQHGQGTMTSPDGRVRCGVWHKGRRVDATPTSTPRGASPSPRTEDEKSQTTFTAGRSDRGSVSASPRTPYYAETMFTTPREPGQVVSEASEEEQRLRARLAELELARQSSSWAKEPPGRGYNNVSPNRPRRASPRQRSVHHMPEFEQIQEEEHHLGLEV